MRVWRWPQCADRGNLLFVTDGTEGCLGRVGQFSHNSNIVDDEIGFAMEATGVYWLPLYGVLEAAHLEVRMVNGRQTRNLPGRKTDMADSQWGATLHMHGLLKAGFVPPADIRRLQDYLRLRADHVAVAASCVQLMQKALERMNIKLHDVIA